MSALYFLTLAVLVVAAYVLATSRAKAISATAGSTRLHSLPSYHGMYAAALVLIPMLLIYMVSNPLFSRIAETLAIGVFPAEVASDELRRGSTLRDIKNIVLGQHSGDVGPQLKSAVDVYKGWLNFGSLATLVGGGLFGLAAIAFARGRVSTHFRARNNFERIVKIVLIVCAAIAILTTVGIVFSVLYETARFFFDTSLKGRPTVSEFLFGTEWNPQAALRADQGDIKTAFGFVPLLTGTLLITFIAIVVAGPLGLFSAIYLSEYASKRVRSIAKPMLEILAGIPTVVLGFFAALTVAPMIRGWGEYFGLDVASESALAASWFSRWMPTSLSE